MYVFFNYFLALYSKDGDVWTAENGIDYFKKIVYERQLSCSMVFRKEHPVLLDGWKSTCVDLIWDELKLDGPFSRERKITCFMSQQLVSQNFANAPTIEGEWSKIDNPIVLLTQF